MPAMSPMRSSTSPRVIMSWNPTKVDHVGVVMLCTPTWFTVGRARHSVVSMPGGSGGSSLPASRRAAAGSAVDPLVVPMLSVGSAPVRSVTLHGLLNVSEPAQRGDDVEAITIAEHA